MTFIRAVCFATFSSIWYYFSNIRTFFLQTTTSPIQDQTEKVFNEFIGSLNEEFFGKKI